MPATPKPPSQIRRRGRTDTAQGATYTRAKAAGFDIQELKWKGPRGNVGRKGKSCLAEV
jgi:hypothetical protein